VSLDPSAETGTAAAAERDHPDQDRHEQKHSAGPRPGETQAERDDRNLMELLQELRVAGLGVQVLFGFLLSIPFSNGFSKLHPNQRDLYLCCLMLTALSTALLLGPVAYHRLVFRRQLKEGLVRTANLMAIAGLITVMLAVCSSVLLLISFVAAVTPAVLITALLACVFIGLWFVLPLARRGSQESRR
jgi:Family of unknown function (DUF6328)